MYINIYSYIIYYIYYNILYISSILGSWDSHCPKLIRPQSTAKNKVPGLAISVLTDILPRRLDKETWADSPGET